MANASRSTRHLGHICRIYKNSSDKVIAIDDISITANILSLPKSTTELKYHISIEQPDIHRTLLHLGIGNRVVNLIQMVGDYSSVEENSGNYFVIQWDATSGDENNVQISLEPYVSKIGDTI